MVNLLKYIEEKNGTFESPRYSRGLVIAEFVIAEFHCITFVKIRSHSGVSDRWRELQWGVSDRLRKLYWEVLDRGRKFHWGLSDW